MSSSNCCFLTCIQISQEECQVIWYSHLFQNFPQFIVIHTVKGFGIVNKAEIDVFNNFLTLHLHYNFLICFRDLVKLNFPALIFKTYKKINKCIESESEVAQSCLTLCDPMDSSLHQAPPSMGFSRQEYWSGLPFPSPGILPDPGIEPRSPAF